MYYFDEDTWQAVLEDRWDGKGQLWKSMWSFNYILPDLPGVVDHTFGHYDVLAGMGFIGNVMNDKAYQLRIMPRWPTVMFAAEGLVAQGVR